MKTTLLLSAVIAKIASVIGCIWAITSFVLYLVNNKPFDWRSIWLIVLPIVLFGVITIIALLFEVKKEQKELEQSYKGVNKTSAFANRLREMELQRNSNKITNGKDK